MLRTATYQFESFSEFYVVKTLYTHTKTRNTYNPTPENIVLVIKRDPQLLEGQVNIITHIIPQITITLNYITIFEDCKNLLLISDHPYTNIFIYIEEKSLFFDKYNIAKSFIKYLVFTCLSWISCVEEFITNGGQNESSVFFKACMTFALRHTVIEVFSYLLNLTLTTKKNIDTLKIYTEQTLRDIKKFVLEYNTSLSVKFINTFLDALFSSKYHKKLGIQRFPLKENGQLLIEYRGFINNTLWKNFISKHSESGIIQMQEQRAGLALKKPKILNSPIASLGNVDITFNGDNNDNNDNDVGNDDNDVGKKRPHNSGGTLRRKQKNKNKSRVKKLKSNRRTRRRY
jgi:hypothetical protein